MLDELTAFGPFFAVTAHPSSALPGPPWRSASELARPSGPLRARVEAVRAALAAKSGRGAEAVEMRVAASTVHLGLVARLTAPALGAAVLRCPLDLRPGGLWWQDVAGGPAPLSVPVPPGSGQAAREWDRVLVDQLLAPVTTAISRLASVSDRVLWGNVASGVNAAAVQVARQRPDLAPEAWLVARRLFASPHLRGERHPPGPAFRRSSCCLFYRLSPDRLAICGDCVLAGRISDAPGR